MRYIVNEVMNGEKLTSKPTDAKAEKIPKVDFWDLVIGEGKDGHGDSITYIDSLRLEEVLVSGALPFEDFAEVFPGGETAEWHLAHDHNPEWYKRFATVNPKYIIVENNTDFWITSHDGEKLFHDLASWLQGKAKYVEVYNQGNDTYHGGAAEHLRDDLQGGNSIHIDYVADYPTLQHTLTLEEVSEKDGKITLRGSFTQHKTMHQNEQDQHLKAGEPINWRLLQHGDPLDFISLLKIVNGFKRAGYEMEVSLTQGPLFKKDENGVIVKRLVCRGK